MMSKDPLKTAINRYGPNLDRWPEKLRKQAQERRRADSTFAAGLREEAELTAILAARPIPATPPDLSRRILQKARLRRPVTAGDVLALLLLPRPAVTVFSLLLTGIALGMSFPSATASPLDPLVLSLEEESFLP